MAAGGKAGSGSPSQGAVAAMAPTPLAAAPEQALRAEVSETASEPDRLFAPDFIISQVRPSEVAPIESTQSARVGFQCVVSDIPDASRSCCVCSEVVYFNQISDASTHSV